MVIVNDWIYLDEAGGSWRVPTSMTCTHTPHGGRRYGRSLSTRAGFTVTGSLIHTQSRGSPPGNTTVHPTVTDCRTAPGPARAPTCACPVTIRRHDARKR